MSTSLIALLALTAVAQPAGEKNATPEQAKKAVERSLPFLREDGVHWIRDKQCHSCHHVGFMVWSLNEANRRGFKVDMDELKASSEWAVQYASYNAVFYQIKDPTLNAVKKAGLADEKVNKLKDIKQVFATASEFRSYLTPALTKDVLAQHEDLIFKSAALPGQGGKGEDADPKGARGPGTVASELLLAGAPGLTKDKGEATKALIQRLVTTQQKDGSWKHGGQYDALNRPAQESTEVVTAWNALALIDYDDLPEPAAKTRAQALAYLKNSKTGVSTEWYVAQTLVAWSVKDTERAEALLKELRTQQLPDGGWSWLKANKQSDAWATGMALYALGRSGADNSDPAVTKAWSFLVKTQLDGGDWLVSTGPIRKGGAKKSTDPIFSYWGTGWAAIGIMQTLPK